MSGFSSVSVWIKLSSAVEDEFVHVSCHPSTYIADVAALACSACPSWQLKANRVRIYLIAKAGEAKPNQKKIDEVISSLEPLSGETTLESHGISSGAWLVARPTQSMTSFASGLLGRRNGNDMEFSFPQIHPVVDVTIESLLIAGGVASPQESVIRRAYTLYGGAVVAALAGRGRVQAAVDVYRLAESLPSLTTVNQLQLEGITINGPLHEGSPVTRCFRNRFELVLKPLDKREHDRALAFSEAINGNSAISGLTTFELRSTTKGKHFMLMPVFGASLECLSLLDNEDITELWRCMRNALRGLHGFGFAHMDIKPANICLDRRAFVLIDLGSVTRFGEAAATTPPYVARDFPGGMLYSSALADWWLLAMTLAEKATGLRVGVVDRPTMAMLSKRLEEKLPPDVWAELREELNTNA